MRMRPLIRSLSCSLTYSAVMAVLVGVGSASAQVPAQVPGWTGQLPPAPMVGGGSMGLGSGSGVFVLPAIKGQPYSLVETMTTVQTLADGTTITRVSQSRHMRDSEGRTRMEMGVMKDGALQVTAVRLDDPVSRAAVTLFPRSKTANITRFPEPTPESAQQEARMAELRAKAEANRKEHPAPPNVEDLGIQTIAGGSAEGKRHTLVIPVGRMGNDREITVVTETWTSPELKIIVGSTTDDPQMGKTTMVVSDLQRAEPDPALFQVPSDYRVTETPAPHIQ
jgi:hypothetical protein